MALTDKLKVIADAIRSKTGKSDSMTLADMPTEIDSIETGGGGDHSEYINPEWTSFRYFSYKNNRNSLVSKLKFSDTSNGTTFAAMCSECSSLITVPQIDTSNGTNFNSMFYGCSSLITVPQIDTSNGTDFTAMFYGCSSLITVPQIDTSNGTNFNSMFHSCSSLQNVTFAGIFPITQNLSVFNYCPNLTVDSLMSFINALSDNTGISTTYKVTIGSANLAKLTADQIQIATNKNITLA